MYKFIEIVEIDSNKVDRRYNVTNKSDRYIDKLEMGLMRKIDFDRYFVHNHESQEELPTI